MQGRLRGKPETNVRGVLVNTPHTHNLFQEPWALSGVKASGCEWLFHSRLEGEKVAKSAKHIKHDIYEPSLEECILDLSSTQRSQHAKHKTSYTSLPK